MIDLYQQLREANAAIDAHFGGNLDAPHPVSPEEIWNSLSPAAVLIAAIEPALPLACCQTEEAPFQAELQRYVRNLQRIQNQCEASLCDLDGRRRQLWREEQALHSNRAWQTQY